MTFSKWNKKYGEYHYSIFRIVIGALLAMHGAQKFGMFNNLLGELNLAGFAGFAGVPLWLAGVVATIELVGGLAIMLGLFTRPAAVLAGIVMIAALFMIHFPQGWNPLGTGAELPLVYLVAFLVMIVNGAGRWSLEKTLMKKERF